MPSRNVMDNHINAWKNSAKLEQTNGRNQNRWGNNYGQVLRGNNKPSDQTEDGPQFPANLAAFSTMNVKEEERGFSWFSLHIAEENGTEYTKQLSSFEDGPIVETDWVEVIPAPPL